MATWNHLTQRTCVSFSLRWAKIQMKFKLNLSSARNFHITTLISLASHYFHQMARWQRGFFLLLPATFARYLREKSMSSLKIYKLKKFMKFTSKWPFTIQTLQGETFASFNYSNWRVRTFNQSDSVEKSHFTTLKWKILAVVRARAIDWSKNS